MHTKDSKIIAMPFKSEKIIICGTQYDRRQKLTPEQREEIFRRAITRTALASDNWPANTASAAD